MKVIDLLNKIANGEEVPKEVEYKGSILHYNYELNDYCCNYEMLWEDVDGGKHTYWLFDKPTYNDKLNDEVEILEEEKKIPEKLEEFDIQGLEVSGYSMTQAEYLLEDGVKENRKMINWILDYLKSKGK